LHRIKNIVIKIPPLRERKEDIPILIEGIVHETVTKENLQVNGLNTEATKTANNYSWPGNIRELEATISAACARANFFNRTLVEPVDLKIRSENNRKNLEYSSGFREQIQKFEKELVLEALKLNNNNQTRAAKQLNLDRSSFRRILSRLNE